MTAEQKKLNEIYSEIEVLEILLEKSKEDKPIVTEALNLIISNLKGKADCLELSILRSGSVIIL